MGVIQAVGIDQEDLLFGALEQTLAGDKVMFGAGRLDSSEIELCFGNMLGLQQMISESMVVLGELAEKPGKGESKASRLKTRNYMITGKRSSTVELTICGMSDKQREYLEGPYFSGAEISILIAPNNVETVDPGERDQHVVYFNGLRWTVDWSGEVDGLWTVVISTELNGTSAGSIYPATVSAVPDMGVDPRERTWVATDGSDTSGDGTYLRPYATLGKAESLTLADSFSTIFIKTGTYKENNTYVKAYTWRAFGGNVTLQNGTSGGGVINIGIDSRAQWHGTAASRIVVDAEAAVSYLVNLNTATAGAGRNATVAFSHCDFIRPKTAGYGVYYTMSGSGSTSRYDGFDLSMEECTFTGNTRSWIYCGTQTTYPRDLVVEISDCEFSGNCDYNTISLGASAGDASAAEITARIENCSFGKNTSGHDIWVAKSGAYAINGNTFTYTGTPGGVYSCVRSVGAAAQLGISGVVECNNNVVNFGSHTTTAYAVDFRSGALYDVECSGNEFTIGTGNTAFNGGCISATDMTAFVCEGNVCDMRYANPASQKAAILFTNPTVECSGAKLIRGNVLHSGAAAGYMMKVGSDGPMAVNDNADGVIISGNVFYGSRCYSDPGAASHNHSLMLGYTKDYIVAHNYFIGCRIGMVIEHDNLSDAGAGAVVMNNVWVDTAYPLACGGLNDIRIYGNTFINRTAMTQPFIAHGFNESMQGFAISAAESHNGGTQTKIKYAAGYPPAGSSQLTVVNSEAVYALEGDHAIASIDQANKQIILNTAWSAAFAPVPGKTTFNISWNGSSAIDGLEIKNNVFYAETGNNIVCISANSGSAFAAGGCDHNLIYTSTPTYLGANSNGQRSIAQWLGDGNDTHSVWGGTPGSETCVEPDIDDLYSAMEKVLGTPSSGGNLEAAGVNLAEDYPDTNVIKHAITAGSEPPVSAAETDNQPEKGAWTIGAVLPEAE